MTAPAPGSAAAGVVPSVLAWGTHLLQRQGGWLARPLPPATPTGRFFFPLFTFQPLPPVQPFSHGKAASV